MRNHRKARIGFTSLVLVVGGLAATTMPSAAQPAPGTDPAADASAAKYRKIKHCDDTATIGIFSKTKTVTSTGRTARLYTEKEPDDRAYAYAYDIAQGDKVYVQRSKNTFEMPDGDRGWHPGKSRVYEMGAVRSCENTAGWFEANVNDHMFTDAVTLQFNFVSAYAVRTCINPTNGPTKCSKWWVDHKD
ncbi:hypothetical protein [Streptomyces ureilyticus]|uniref:Secreted protein n=1 Tax=Streptomyces ureilyticus TaxID=1775131 RepID=A0ABX0DZK9_9ACTN|nr:hypothetical protein [Streptomyces ureilyticus]NGO47380.1 hypothetical protein [Streptomyces ureilyticus]